MQSLTQQHDFYINHNCYKSHLDESPLRRPLYLIQVFYESQECVGQFVPLPRSPFLVDVAPRRLTLGDPLGGVLVGGQQEETGAPVLERLECKH